MIEYVTNERRSGVPQRLTGITETRPASLILDYGWKFRDTQLRIEVERKSLTDFYRSVASRHLQDQLYRAYEAGIQASILLELDSTQSHPLSILAEPWIIGFIRSVQSQGIGFLLSPGREYSHLVIHQTYKNDQKLVHTSIAPHKVAEVKKTDKTFIDEVDYVLPDVGTQRSKDIAKRLEHWYGIVTATVEQLRSAEVSDHLARKIHGYVRGTRPQ